MSDMRDTPQLPPQPRWGVISVALMVIGLLILVPSGLCTGLMGLGALFSVFTGNVRDATSTLAMVAVVGGIPVVIGGVLVFAALKLRRKG
ncbi:MAG TPA: hypothetical protein VGM17_09345 [Rhizomicrobium sp.]|jgi:hypothetical protein